MHKRVMSGINTVKSSYDCSFSWTLQASVFTYRVPLPLEHPVQVTSEHKVVTISIHYLILCDDTKSSFFLTCDQPTFVSVEA